VKALVTGGGGFLGKTIVKMLLARGDKVRTFHRGAYPELAELGVETQSGDLADKKAVASAASGVDVVFHVAAKAGVWGKEADYYSANVVGTKNIISACRENNVSRLVYTSTPSVVFDGKDENGIDESVPYPAGFLNFYGKTKAEAEKIVLTANSPDLSTVALRPHLIWGPNDPHLIPRLLDRADKGKLKLVGKRKNLVDSTYVENAALAHIMAADNLKPGSPPAGKAYFISNGEPVPMAELLNKILACAGKPPVSRTVPAWLAYAVGAILEFSYSAAKIKSEPIMTRFVAKQLSTAHWFDLSAAKKDLGYQPKISLDKGFELLARSFEQNKSK